jgi:3-deoxy-D-arabino-heptulosonate 7-phosphate (DAHP) synthase
MRAAREIVDCVRRIHGQAFMSIVIVSYLGAKTAVSRVHQSQAIPLSVVAGNKNHPEWVVAVRWEKMSLCAYQFSDYVLEVRRASSLTDQSILACDC